MPLAFELAGSMSFIFAAKNLYWLAPCPSSSSLSRTEPAGSKDQGVGQDDYHGGLLLVPLVTVYRYEGEEINATLAKSEAKLLHEKISKKAYNDEELIRILTTRSKAQLRATINDYNNAFGNAISKDLHADPKDEFLSALRAVIKCLLFPEKYFEKVIRLAINKMGTDEGALTRVVTTRTEVDMKAIKDLYFKRNNVPLDHAIKKDTKGDYEDFLLALIGHEEA